MSVQKLNLTNVQGHSPRVKPTVATILRERKVVDSRDAIERQELESLMSGGLSAENYKYWLLKRREEEERRQEEKLEERKLAVKETNQRILEMAKQKLEEKRLAAQKVREEEIELKQKLAQRNEEETECARDRVDKIMLEEMKSQIAVFKKQREKEFNAREVQKRSEMLAEKSKKIKAQEEAQRKDKIQKIQAAAAVSQRIRKLYNPADYKGRGLHTEMSDSEAKLRIHFQKAEEAARIEETRCRVKAEKELRKERLNEAIQKISAYRELMKKREKYKI